MKNLLKLKKRYHSLQVLRKSIRDTLKADNLKIKKSEMIIETSKKSIVIISTLIEGRYGEVVSFFEKVITSGVQAVFDNSYDIKIKTRRKANKNYGTFLVACSEYPGYLPFKMCHGDGLKQFSGLVASIVLCSINNGKLKTIFVDEPLSGLDADKEEAVGEFLTQICKELKVQLVMVTHKRGLRVNAENVINVKDRI